MWLVLNNKVLTLDNLQKRGRSSPSRCPLCRIGEEIVYHLFLFCDYNIILAKYGELEVLSSNRLVWSGISVEGALNGWLKQQSLKEVKTLPVIVFCGFGLLRMLFYLMKGLLYHYKLLLRV